MDLVRKTPAGYETDDVQAALEKLAALERLCNDTRTRQQALTEKLAALRAEKKERSVQFREALAEKLTNGAVLSALEAYGLIG